MAKQTYVLRGLSCAMFASIGLLVWSAQPGTSSNKTKQSAGYTLGWACKGRKAEGGSALLEPTIEACNHLIETSSVELRRTYIRWRAEAYAEKGTTKAHLQAAFDDLSFVIENGAPFGHDYADRGDLRIRLNIDLEATLEAAVEDYDTAIELRLKRGKEPRLRVFLRRGAARASLVQLGGNPDLLPSALKDIDAFLDESPDHQVAKDLRDWVVYRLREDVRKRGGSISRG